MPELHDAHVCAWLANWADALGYTEEEIEIAYAEAYDDEDFRNSLWFGGYDVR